LKIRTSSSLISVQFSSFTEGKKFGFYTFSIQRTKSAKTSRKSTSSWLRRCTES
jgi:hypothetical protein